MEPTEHSLVERRRRERKRLYSHELKNYYIREYPFSRQQQLTNPKILGFLIEELRKFDGISFNK